MVEKKRKTTRPLRAETVLKRMYENPRNPASFSSPRKLYMEAKKYVPKITQAYVNDWLSTQRAYTLNRKAISRFKRRPVLVKGIGHQYQADILDYHLIGKHNRGYKYLLTMIDCFSRRATAIPLKTKTGLDVLSGFRRAFSIMKPPKLLQTDKGSEFYNFAVSSYLKKNGIHHFSTDQELKAQIVERFNRTLRERIQRFMTANNTHCYIDDLPDLLHGYNSAPHRTLGGLSPGGVTKKNEKQIREKLYGKYISQKTKKKRKFKIGDIVRIASYRKTFQRSFHETFTEELFRVTDVLDTNPVTYRVMGVRDKELIKGSFYEYQLQKVRI